MVLILQALSLVGGWVFMCVVVMVFLMGWLTLVLGVGWLDGLGFGLGDWVCQSCGTL